MRVHLGGTWHLTRLKEVRVLYPSHVCLPPIPAPEPSSHIDNEYSRAGIMDPKIIVTTSRDPSSKLLQFAKVYP